MKDVLAMFNEEKDADAAMKAIETADFDAKDVRIREQSTIEGANDIVAAPAVGPGGVGAANASGPAGSTGTTGVAAMVTDDTVEGFLSRLGLSGDAHAFYAHGIREGGYIVIASVANHDADKALRILKDKGGRVPQIDA